MEVSGTFCNKKIPIKLKDKLYKIMVRLIMMYRSVNGIIELRMSVAERIMLWWKSGVLEYTK